MDLHVPSSKNILNCIRSRTQMMPSNDSLRHFYQTAMLSDTDRLYSRDLKGHFSCVNAMSLSNKSQDYLASGGDDKRILLWDMSAIMDGIRAPTPSVIKTNHYSNIFTLSFSCDNNYIFSAGNDGLIITHDIKRGDSIKSHQHLGPVYCVDAHPTSPNLVAVATHEGTIYINDTRTTSSCEDCIVEEHPYSYHSVAINPTEPHLLAAGNELNGAALYDLRKIEKVVSYKVDNIFNFCFGLPITDIMSVCFNYNGTRLCVLPRGDAPKVFKIQSPIPEFHCTSDENYTFSNSVTMKSLCFAGDQDEYIVSGSDDFQVYWWKMSTQDKQDQATEPSPPINTLPPYLIMPGHRSIVNQTRYSSVHSSLISSGVEKSLKVWTPFPVHKNHIPNISHGPPVRACYTRNDLVTLSLEGDFNYFSDTSVASENIEESSRSLAYFDQIISQEEEGVSSDDDHGLFPLIPMFRSLDGFNNEAYYSSEDDSDDIDEYANSSSLDSFGDSDSFDHSFDHSMDDHSLNLVAFQSPFVCGCCSDVIYSDSDSESASSDLVCNCDNGLPLVDTEEKSTVTILACSSIGETNKNTMENVMIPTGTSASCTSSSDNNHLTAGGMKPVSFYGGNKKKSKAVVNGDESLEHQSSDNNKRSSSRPRRRPTGHNNQSHTRNLQALREYFTKTLTTDTSSSQPSNDSIPTLHALNNTADSSQEDSDTL